LRADSAPAPRHQSACAASSTPATATAMSVRRISGTSPTSAEPTPWALRAAQGGEMGPGSRYGPRPQVGNSLACAEFDRRVALAPAVDSRGVELGDNKVVATVFRSNHRA